MADLAVVRIGVGCAGIAIVYYTLVSAIKTVVLPRADRVPLTNFVFAFVRKIFEFYAAFRLRNRSDYYITQDRIMAMFAPVALLVIPVVWAAAVLLGYSFIYWALDVQPLSDAITMSGSSLLTLGTVPFVNPLITLVEFSEALIGLGIVALLIAYLPTMYGAFSKREMMVTMLEVRAGSPPSAEEFILRMHRIRGLDREVLNDTWIQWEFWFTEIQESHTSFLPLIFFRSQQPGHSWVTAAGTILDSAALIVSTVDIPVNPQAQLTIRAGYLALRSIAHGLDLDFDADPKPDAPISISQVDFDEVYDRLVANGVPVHADREQAWHDYAGWRVNYDYVLVRLAAIIKAPYAPWSSDRSLPQWIEKTHKAQKSITNSQRQSPS